MWLLEVHGCGSSELVAAVAAPEVEHLKCCRFVEQEIPSSAAALRVQKSSAEYNSAHLGLILNPISARHVQYKKIL